MAVYSSKGVAVVAFLCLGLVLAGCVGQSGSSASPTVVLQPSAYPSTANATSLPLVSSPSPAPSAVMPSPASNSSPAAEYALPFNASFPESPAEIFGLNYSTSPNVIDASKATNLTGLVNASKPIVNLSCKGPSDCACNFVKINAAGKSQDFQFFPDATGESGHYLFNISCNFFPPVNGSYSLSGFDVMGGTETNRISIQFMPHPG